MTGAPIPPGCDAVVMHERTRAGDGSACSCSSPRSGPGKTCCPAAGKCVPARSWSRRGSILRPARLGVLASVGRDRRSRSCRGRWSRSCPPATSWSSRARCRGRARSATRTPCMLHALATRGRRGVDGAADRARPAGTAWPRFSGAGSNADILVITGGVSAGQRDLVPAALEALGVSASSTRCVSSRANPSGSESGRRGAIAPPALVFGLPGNPVSGLVGFLLFVKAGLVGPGRQAGSPDRLDSRPARRADSAIAAIGRHSSQSRMRRPGRRCGAACHRSNPCPGRARPICGPRPAPTVSPSSPPAIAITHQAKLSTSSPCHTRYPT